MVNSRKRGNNSNNRSKRSNKRNISKPKELTKPKSINYLNSIKSKVIQIKNRILSLIKSFLHICLNTFLNIKSFFSSTIFVVAMASGGFAAVCMFLIIFQYIKPKINTEELEQKISSLEIKQEDLGKLNKSINDIKNNISEINSELITLKLEFQNNEMIPESIQFEENSDRINNLEKSLEQVIKNTKKSTKVIISGSQTETAAKLGLTTLLMKRLASGVPYAGILEGLELEEIDPALIRFANAGAPTIADLAARLSGRAGEVRDANRTANESGWRDKIAGEISEVISIRRSNPSNIRGAKGALLRAENSLINGKLNDAIEQIQSIDPQYHGPLAAWLIEATARQQADRAAEKLLKSVAAKLKSER